MNKTLLFTALLVTLATVSQCQYEEYVNAVEEYVQKEVEHVKIDGDIQSKLNDAISNMEDAFMMEASKDDIAEPYTDSKTFKKLNKISKTVSKVVSKLPSDADEIKNEILEKASSYFFEIVNNAAYEATYKLEEPVKHVISTITESLVKISENFLEVANDQ